MTGDTTDRSAGAPLGVFDALGLGWRLMASDFWRLWLVALVLMLVVMGASVFGLPATILVVPPLVAGLFYVLGRRMDGHPTGVADLFTGFKKRFGESVIAYLPVSLGSIVFGVVFTLATWLLMGLCFAVAAAAEGEEAVVGVTVVVGILVGAGLYVCLIAGLSLLVVFFYFVPAAVWDYPGSGWEAAKASMGLVRDHFLSMLGLLVVFTVIGWAAGIVGMLLCCVGWLFTTPVITVWFYATLLYLYRSWTGNGGGTTAMAKVE